MKPAEQFQPRLQHQAGIRLAATRASPLPAVTYFSRGRHGPGPQLEPQVPCMARGGCKQGKCLVLPQKP